MAFVNGAVSLGQSEFVGSKAPTCAVRQSQNTVTMAVSGSTYLLRGGRLLVLRKKSPTSRCEEYMQATIEKAYKEKTMNVTGIYSTQCAEGASKGAAEQARVRALSAKFRMNQVSPREKAQMMYDNRKAAIINSHGCNHEEKMFVNYPKCAATYNIKQSEAMLTCTRYGIPESYAEKYMAQSVENQMKARAVPNGEYTTKCSDGAWKDLSESARVAALSTRYRTAQMSPIAREQAKYNSANYAIANFGHGCGYEEDIFNKYPSVAGAMRSRAYGQ